MLAIDEEAGDVSRLDAERGGSWPGALALGAIDDVEATGGVAGAIGARLADAGVTLDFAPVADVNSDPRNPVIGVRSFGDDPALVGRHVAAFVEGLQAAGVAACAKHFPGHGDTTVDSRHALPRVEADLETLHARELRPFRDAVAAGVRAVMTAHIVVPALDERPATVSPRVLALLGDELGFDGAIVSDALEMQGLAATVGVVEGAVQALAAGVDALCVGHDLHEEAVAALAAGIARAVEEGRLPQERLAEAVARTAALGRPVRGAAPAAPDAASLARRALRVAGDPAVGTGALVLALRDASRHSWQRTLAERVLERRADAVVVETGLPGWLPEGARATVETRGAARVSLEAAAEALLGSEAPSSPSILLVELRDVAARLLRRQTHRDGEGVGDDAEGRHDRDVPSRCRHAGKRPPDRATVMPPSRRLPRAGAARARPARRHRRARARRP